MVTATITQAPESHAHRIWECVLCGFRYDEAVGDPDSGIPPGTRWEDIPEDWSCPECSAAKSEFDMRVVE